MIGRAMRAIALGAFCISIYLALPVAADDTVNSLRGTIDALRRQLDDVQHRLDAIEKQQESPAPVSPTPAATAPPSPAAAKPSALEAYWSNGIHLDSVQADENGVKPFQLRILGTIQNDFGWFTTNHDLDTIGATQDGTEFRRARIGIGGTIYADYDFLAIYDFAGGTTQFKDVYMEAKNIPYVGTLKVGHFNEYASLDLLTSDNDTVFMERALTSVLVPARNVGIGVQNAFFDGRMTAALGVFRTADDFGRASGSDNYAVTGRVTGLPWRAEDGAHFLHLGAWTSLRSNNIDDFRIRQHPEAHLAPQFLDTFGQIGFVTAEWLYGGEAAVVYGPFSVQGEFMQHRLARAAGDTVTMQGGYTLARYILTGEHRTYRPATGVFDRVLPKRNFQIGPGGGPGAWELALRYSHLDLQDADVFGGDEDDVTAGVNWYLNPNMKIMLNYVHAWVNRDQPVTFGATTYPPIRSDFNALMTRFQVVW